MLRSWGSRRACTKRCKIAVGPSSIYYRRWILTCSHCRIWILKCHLKDPTKEICTYQTKFIADGNKTKRRGGKELTKPYPLERPVLLSVMTTASWISPNCSKYLLMVSLWVSQANPPTKIFVYVVSPNCPALLPPPIWNCRFWDMKKKKNSPRKKCITRMQWKKKRKTQLSKTLLWMRGGYNSIHPKEEEHATKQQKKKGERVKDPLKKWEPATKQWKKKREKTPSPTTSLLWKSHNIFWSFKPNQERRSSYKAMEGESWKTQVKKTLLREREGERERWYVPTKPRKGKKPTPDKALKQ